MRDSMLAIKDLRAVLGSLVRSLQLAGGRPHFLFARTQEGCDSQQLDVIGSEMPFAHRLRLAASFTGMFGLASGHAAILARQVSLSDWPEYVRRHWLPEDSSIVFMTSGSTGAPVPCRQNVTLLMQEIHAHAEAFGDRARILTAVPRHHIYGFLFAVLLPRALGLPVFDLPPVPSSSLTSVLVEGDLLVAFPMFWKGLSQLMPTFPRNVHGITSTGPCQPEVIEKLLSRGLQRMTEVYGSSETGGLGIRHDCWAPYTLLPFWKKSHEEASDISLVIRVLPDGSKTAASAMPDTVDWEDENNFRPVRRKDKAVQVAGVNVYPERIASIIKSHPFVAACAVRPMREEEGSRLKAYIVPEAGINDARLRNEMAAWFSKHFSPPETPRKVTFGTALPVNTMGKTCDWE